jgi:gamma-carbonic anhydrase
MNIDRKPFIMPYNGKLPIISNKAFIAPTASIIGDVEIGSGSGVWFNCVIRGDVAYIRIGENTNIQDGTVIHVTRGGFNTIIGSNVTIGHSVIIHACELQDACFVGMGAIIMDNAVVETGAMVAAGSMVTNGKIVKSGEIWAGSPAKKFRDLTEDESRHILVSANNYKKHAQEYTQT